MPYLTALAEFRESIRNLAIEAKNVNILKVNATVFLIVSIFRNAIDCAMKFCRSWGSVWKIVLTRPVSNWSTKRPCAVNRSRKGPLRLRNKL